MTNNPPKLHFRPDQFRTESAELDLASDVTLLAAVRKCFRESGYKSMPRGCAIFVSDDGSSAPYEVPRKQWDSFIIRHGMKIMVTAPKTRGGGGGGKNPLNTILSVVVVVISALMIWNPMGWAGLSAVAFGTGASAVTWGAIAGAAVMMGGMLLVNAIAPMAKPKLSASAQEQPEKAWSLDGVRNRAALYEAVPLPLGKVRFAPRHFAAPYTYLSGKDQYARYLFGVMGHNRVSQLRIGDTPISQFRGVRANVYEKWQGQGFEFFPAAVFQENLGVTLTQASGWHTRTTSQNTVEIQWEIHLMRGLVRIEKNGKRHAHSVTFRAEISEAGANNWRGVFGTAWTNGGNFAAPTNERTTNIYSTPAGALTLSSAGSWWVGSVRHVLRENIVYGGSDWWGDYTVSYSNDYFVSKNPEFSGNIAVAGNIIQVSAGSLNLGNITITEQTVSPIRRGYSVRVPEGQYDFRIIRTSADSNPNDTENTWLDDSTWPVLKSVRSGPVLKYEGTPYTIVELEIMATDQLNGHVDEFNAVYESYCPVPRNGVWYQEPSNNPASLCLMLATGANIGEPVAMSEMDVAAWQGFYQWCEAHGWRYNAVQSSQVMAGELMHGILSAARASFSLRDGLFSVVWDAPDKPVAYPYGPRNSWNFKASKAFVKERVHALRYRFLNETRDYQEDERLVYADGYDGRNAVHILEAEQDGVTNPGLVWKHGRLRLADSIWRPEVYELSTDFSYLCVQKGDRISVTHDVPMWGLRQARILDLAYAAFDFADMNQAALLALANSRKNDIRPGMATPEWTDWLESMDAEELRDMLEDSGIRDTSLVEAVFIDDHVSMESGKSYAFKYFQAGGQPLVYSVEAEDGTFNTLRLAVAIPAMQAPLPDGLIHFGEAGRETHDGIVTDIQTLDNLCAKIIFQDYSADKIYQALTGPIPPWDSDISTESRWQLGRPAAPVITGIETDEYVLLRLADGTLVPRIQVAFSLVERKDVVVSQVRVEFREKDSGAAWKEGGSVSPETGFVFAEGVEELVEYEVRLHAVSNLGVVSNYSAVFTTIVIGRTTPPPPPVSLQLDGTRLWWEMPADFPIDVRGWEVWIGFDEQDLFGYALQVTSPFVIDMEFDIAPWFGWARRAWVRSIDDLGLTSTPISIAFNLGDVPVANVVWEVLEGAERKWPGRPTLTGGSYLPSMGLISSTGRPMWGHIEHTDSVPMWADESLWGDAAMWAGYAVFLGYPMWGDEPMWGGEYRSMVYTTSLVVPPEADVCDLKIEIVMPYGELASVEFAFAASYPAWGDEPMWGDLRWDGIGQMTDWQPMRNSIPVRAGQLILLRVTTASTSEANIAEIIWGFDVEDAELSVSGLFIPASGIRVPVPEKHFRWVKVVNMTMQFTQEYPEAFSAGWLDRGIITDGFVTEGPLVQCKTSQNMLTAGVADVILQGAKGV